EGLVDTKKSIQVGMRGPLYGPEDMQNARDLGYKVIEMREARKLGIEKVIEQIHQRVGNSPVFVQFDIDILDPTYAPGTGTPEVGGPTSFEALEYVRKHDGLNITDFDLEELFPKDDSGEITAVAASPVVFDI